MVDPGGDSMRDRPLGGIHLHEVKQEGEELTAEGRVLERGGGSRSLGGE